MPSPPGEFDFESPDPVEEFDFESPEPVAPAQSRNRVPCPMCGELVASDARICRFCGERLTKDGRARRPIGRGEVDARLVRKFRREVHGLGGFWMLISFICFSVGLVLVNEPQIKLGGPRAFHEILVTLIFLQCAFCFFIGLFTFLKQLWALYAGLIFGYMGIGLSLVQIVNGNICGVLIGLGFYAAVVIQTHRTINWARQMALDGIPLNARPEDFDESPHDIGRI